MQTRFDSGSGTLTILPDARFDFHVAPEFRATYESRIADVHSVVVELTRVTEMDSIALGMLLVLRTEAVRNAATVSLTGANDRVRRVLEAAGFPTLFHVALDLRDGLTDTDYLGSERVIPSTGTRTDGWSLLRLVATWGPHWTSRVHAVRRNRSCESPRGLRAHFASLA